MHGIMFAVYKELITIQNHDMHIFMLHKFVFPSYVLTFVLLICLKFPLETLFLVGRVLADLLVGLIQFVERPGAAHRGVVHRH